MATLSRRERSLIGLAAAAAALIAGYLYVVEPLITRARDAGELATAHEATLERRRALVGQRERLAKELEEVSARLDEQKARLLPGPTPPLAASDLQKVVKELAATAGVEVRSERVLPTAERAGLQEVPLELSVAGSIRQTVTLLARLEQAPMLLTIRDLKVRVVAVGQPRELLASLTVSGYFLPSAKSAKD